MIVLEQAAKPLSTFDRAGNPPDFVTRVNNRIPNALMITLVVIVLQELIDRVAHRPLAEEDHAIQALVFQATHEPLNMCVEIRRPRGQAVWLDACMLKQITKRLAGLGVTIHQQATMPSQEPGLTIRQVPGDLIHPRSRGIGCHPGELNSS